MDGPLCARVCFGRICWRVESERVSGLFVAASRRWPRWGPRSTSKRACDLEGRHPTRALWIVGSTDQHLPWLSLASRPDARCQQGGWASAHYCGLSVQRIVGAMVAQYDAAPSEQCIRAIEDRHHSRPRARHRPGACRCSGPASGRRRPMEIPCRLASGFFAPWLEKRRAVPGVVRAASRRCAVSFGHP